jgi:hypothetical protein
VRGIVAGMFVVGAATIGFGASAMSAGAGVDGIPCEGGQDGVIAPAVRPAQTCAQLEVTKVVTGKPSPGPAPGTTFDVVVNCVPINEDGIMPVPKNGAGAQQLPQGQNPPFTTTLTFPEGGGTQSVFITRSSDCTVSETPPAGCTLTSIDPVKTEIRKPVMYPVTVTNNCDPPVEVQPAAAVVETPRFTG